MNRKDFLRKSGVVGFSFSMLNNCGLISKTCAPTPDETDGPFPTHKPALSVAENIISDRVGLLLAITISINDINNKCMGFRDAIMDIWHCYSQGEYSEYGGELSTASPGIRDCGIPTVLL